MRVITTEQRTPDWHRAHVGRITASNAHLALSGRKTKTRMNYVLKLADDLEGIPDFAHEDNPPWFTDGIFYESWARGWYSFKYDVDVTETGFVVHDEHSWLGCSPDGLIGDDGLIEIKYRKSLRTFKQHAQAEVTRTVDAQLQTQMFVCDRSWVDYVNYWRSIDHDKEQGHVQRVFRNEAYIQNTLLPGFVTLWEDVAAERRERELQRRRANM